jgi:hypothetical protein
LHCDQYWSQKFTWFRKDDLRHIELSNDPTY